MEINFQVSFYTIYNHTNISTPNFPLLTKNGHIGNITF